MCVLLHLRMMMLLQPPGTASHAFRGGRSSMMVKQSPTKQHREIKQHADSWSAWKGWTRGWRRSLMTWKCDSVCSLSNQRAASRVCILCVLLQIPVVTRQENEEAKNEKRQALTGRLRILHSLVKKGEILPGMKEIMPKHAWEEPCHECCCSVCKLPCS